MTPFIVVDGAEIDIKTALQWQMVLGDTSFTELTAKNAAVVQHARKNGISVDAGELQSFFNEYRYELGLETAESFNNWMSENNIGLQTLQNVFEIGVIRNKLRAGITDAEVADYFAINKDAYDVAELYSITVEDSDTADELYSQLEEGEESFQALAVEHSIDGDTFRQGGFVGEVTRETVSGEVEAAVFAASPGDLIGPIKEDDGYTIYMVRNIIRPELTVVLESIRDELFEAKIEEIAGSVKVEHPLLGIVEDDAVDDDDE